MSQITVISGPERRGVWTDQQKRELVAAVSAPGANVAEIARRADLRPSPNAYDRSNPFVLERFSIIPDHTRTN
ncbi:transposase [Sphingobium sp. WCS2017Hpa-17]|uniref:transposase n=1 Tax=Sphingobium sp. WCS2017Hpa-17 TaxID=3073638 RepID=UPI00288B36DF|nr:transposase [Sphingobium sp. WCS2017Hpa-17]